MAIRLIVSLILLCPGLAYSASIRILLADTSRISLHAGEPIWLDSGSKKTQSKSINLRACGRRVCAAGQRALSLAISSEAPWIILGKRKIPVNLRAIVAGKRVKLVAIMEIENYLQGVLGSEMSPSWPLAALQAQAVVARTYTWQRKRRNRNKLFDLSATTNDQVFRFGKPAGATIRKAVRSTAGWIMTLDGDPVEAFFHADCGGHTAGAEEVWGKAVPGIVAVADNWCTRVSRPWIHVFRPADGRRLGVGRLKKIRILKRSASGRVRYLSLQGSRGTRRLRGEELRKLVGYTTIKSTRFDVRNSSEEIQIVGHGYGHGLGLCQTGAREQAMAGRSWQDILDLYFPTTLLIPAE